MTLQNKVTPVMAACLALAISITAHAADWPSWRGPDENGAAEKGKYVNQWGGETNLLWKVALPGKGCSTPIIWKQHIIVTAPIEKQDAVIAYDWSGKQIWATKLGPEREGKHRQGSGCNSSPVTDGKSIFVYFKSGSFAALDLDGKIRWQTNLVEAFGKESLYWDYGTSPVLTKKEVVMVRMHGGESWVASFDKVTGAMRWKTARNYQTPKENDHCYGTPLVIREKGKEVILTWGAEHLTAHDATDGKLLWSCAGFNPDAKQNWPVVASPVVVGDIVVVTIGRADRSTPRLYGVKLGGSGDVTASNHVWFRNDVGTFVPTPAEYKGKLYIVRDRGEVDCLDPITGKTIWTDAFPKASMNFYSSPVITDGKLYAIREDGAVFVANIKDKFELLAENAMDDHVIASPILLDNRIIIRGEQNLFSLGTK